MTVYCPLDKDQTPHMAPNGPYDVAFLGPSPPHTQPSSQAELLWLTPGGSPGGCSHHPPSSASQPTPQHLSQGATYKPPLFHRPPWPVESLTSPSHYHLPPISRGQRLSLECPSIPNTWPGSLFLSRCSMNLCQRNQDSIVDFSKY